MSSRFAVVSLPKYSRLFLLFLAPLVLWLCAAAAPFQQTSSPSAKPKNERIGIINIRAAIMACNEGSREFEALSKKFEPRQNELQQLNKEVEDLKKQLSAGKDKMSAEARNTLSKTIDTKTRTLKQSAENSQREFQKQQNDIGERILQKMAPMIKKYASENSYGLLLDSSNPWPQGPLLWAAPSVDITKAVVDAYNAQSVAPAPAKQQTPAPKAK
ncbi:MAG TPA: OmpH family outer membrane protein [Acidobacteriota bacterium]|nr:OmpH family outer membrane protein [Acidobacteriota bacterium]